MNFEDVLDQEKNELIESFLVSGEGKRLNKVLADLEKNRLNFISFIQQVNNHDKLRLMNYRNVLMMLWRSAVQVSGNKVVTTI